MSVPVVRTITLGIAEAHPISRQTFEKARLLLQQAQQRYNAAGYVVQTVRLSTRPLLTDLADWSPAAILKYAQDVQGFLDSLQLENCSLGTAFAYRPDFSLERLDVLGDILIATNSLNATVSLADAEHGLRFDAALPIAHLMLRLAHETPEGFGNFRFAMLACVPPNGPFFPAAYHAGASTITIGLQGAQVVMQALEELGADGRRALDLPQITNRVRTTLEEQAGPVVALGQTIAREQGVRFGGIDLSPAPMGEVSIVRAMELCGYGPLGSSGTLAVAAALTTALKETSLPTCGYNGLMLPVLEDVVLGQRWEERRINAHQLLLYSAVCGTGLDTIPLAGDSTPESIAYLLLDVATLALRYQKPLSARLFPVPGRRAGELTQFTSPYLTNTRITEE
ncbi:hypothetical protein KDA_26880 [Dictyobacter alpinus]|uniref:Uncharacterized protein n=1 Tax=Dictyobacter alpinus TaxID=2014873 RepID=A0A402B768_9CHLR|nr:DUF711 family protein [Dictyobacter alpinus]GCE27204.1 hypothetical protein KDA_26880 [Dictyobacter alpinus]